MSFFRKREREREREEASMSCPVQHNNAASGSHAVLVIAAALAKADWGDQLPPGQTKASTSRRLLRSVSSALLPLSSSFGVSQTETSCYVPLRLGVHPELDSLDLSNGKIRRIPQGIAVSLSESFPNLTMLCLDNNLLERLPAELFLLTQLRSLWLYDNSLAAIPREIAALVHLRFLHIERNRIKQPPVELGRLHSLRMLSLDRDVYFSLLAASAIPPEACVCFGEKESSLSL